MESSSYVILHVRIVFIWIIHMLIIELFDFLFLMAYHYLVICTVYQAWRNSYVFYVPCPDWIKLIVVQHSIISVINPKKLVYWLDFRCGHMCCCVACCSHLTNCPLCRRRIELVVKTYRHWWLDPRTHYHKPSWALLYVTKAYFTWCKNLTSQLYAATSPDRRLHLISEGN